MIIIILLLLLLLKKKFNVAFSLEELQGDGTTCWVLKKKFWSKTVGM